MKNFRKHICRGKCTDNGKWVTGYYVIITDTDDGLTSHRIYTGTAENGEEWYKVDPGTVGQSTCVTDRFGNEIFEDDVVRYRRTDERYTKNPEYDARVVAWDGHYSCWGYEGVHKPQFESHRMELLGNVHDNPKLRELILRKGQ